MSKVLPYGNKTALTRAFNAEVIPTGSSHLRNTVCCLLTLIEHNGWCKTKLLYAYVVV